ncbi:MAG: hypothetical protein WAW46_02730 [Polaromonas sp.]
MGNKGSGGGGSSISMGITGPGGTIIGTSLFGTGVTGTLGVGCGMGMLTGMNISKNHGENTLFILSIAFLQGIFASEAGT